MDYMDRWHGKHPIPWDFFNSFNNISGKNLNWFWNNWFFSNNYIDLAIEKPVKSKQGYTINILNKGGFAVPVDLQVEYSDGSTELIHKTPEIWQADEKKAKISVVTAKIIRSVETKKSIFMDANEKDNKWIQ